LHLQNLAFLGADGKVHTVNQQQNGVRMLGASAPQLDLQNLAFLGADGKVHTVNQQQNGTPLLGATAPHLDLQNLAYMDELELQQLGLLSGLKHRAEESQFIDHSKLDQLSGKVNNMKHAAHQLGHAAKDTAHSMGGIIDRDAVKAAAKHKLHNAGVMLHNGEHMAV